MSYGNTFQNRLGIKTVVVASASTTGTSTVVVNSINGVSTGLNVDPIVSTQAAFTSTVGVSVVSINTLTNVLTFNTSTLRTLFPGEVIQLWEFNFTKFGSAINPFGDLDQRLSKQTNLIRDNTATVYTAIANSDVSTSTYFKNPVASVVSSLTNVVSTLYNTIWNYGVSDEFGTTYILRPKAPGMDTTYTALVQELDADDNNANGTPKIFNSFISHSDRLSNLKTSNKSTRPSFSSAQSVLQTVQTLIYQTETTSTSTVGAIGLGAFTSLFIGSDLSGYWSSLTNNLSVITGLLSTNPTSVTSPIATAVTNANTNFTNLLGLLETRREHDENFYQNAISISQDFGKINNNKNAASTASAVSSYLIDNLIGTDALKNL